MSQIQPLTSQGKTAVVAGLPQDPQEARQVPATRPMPAVLRGTSAPATLGAGEPKQHDNWHSALQAHLLSQSNLRIMQMQQAQFRQMHEHNPPDTRMSIMITALA